MTTIANSYRRSAEPRVVPRAASVDPFDLKAFACPHLKVWVSWNGDFLLGPRYVRLLEQVDRAGAIRKACPATGLSYRTWLTRLRRLEETLGTPVLTTHRGGASRGSATLTPMARQLVRVYRQWREDVERASQRRIARTAR